MKGLFWAGEHVGVVTRVVTNMQIRAGLSIHSPTHFLSRGFYFQLSASHVKRTIAFRWKMRSVLASVSAAPFMDLRKNSEEREMFWLSCSKSEMK